MLLVGGIVGAIITVGAAPVGRPAGKLVDGTLVDVGTLDEGKLEGMTPPAGMLVAALAATADGTNGAV